jgi:hypothetical protein
MGSCGKLKEPETHSSDKLTRKSLSLIHWVRAAVRLIHFSPSFVYVVYKQMIYDVAHTLYTN